MRSFEEFAKAHNEQYFGRGSVWDGFSLEGKQKLCDWLLQRIVGVYSVAICGRSVGPRGFVLRIGRVLTMQRIVDVCELFLSMVVTSADHIADQAAPGSGESMFEIEGRLLRHLHKSLPEMIRTADEAALMDRLEDRLGCN
jgi:hypothetical protein